MRQQKSGEAVSVSFTCHIGNFPKIHRKGGGVLNKEYSSYPMQTTAWFNRIRCSLVTLSYIKIACDHLECIMYYLLIYKRLLLCDIWELKIYLANNRSGIDRRKSQRRAGFQDADCLHFGFYLERSKSFSCRAIFE